MTDTTVDINADFLLNHTAPWQRYRDIVALQVYWTEYGHQRLEIGRVTLNGKIYQETNERSSS